MSIKQRDIIIREIHTVKLNKKTGSHSIAQSKILQYINRKQALITPRGKGNGSNNKSRTKRYGTRAVVRWGNKGSNILGNDCFFSFSLFAQLALPLTSFSQFSGHDNTE
jgi:hypothetical protein